MALQSEAIESRLAGLKLDERRMLFDSQLRAIRADNKVTDAVQHRASRFVRKAEQVGPIEPSGQAGPASQPDPIEQVVALIVELSRRIDGLERKDRALAEEIRRRERLDRRRRSIYLACGLVAAILTLAGGMLPR